MTEHIRHFCYHDDEAYDLHHIITYIGEDTLALFREYSYTVYLFRT